jgi:membrane protease YdiL (CAAX protease family)
MDASENTTQQGGRLGESFLSDRALAAWEIGSVVSSVFIAEWIGAVTSDWTKLVLAIPIGLAFVLAINSHRLRGESLRDLGFRFDNFLRAGARLLVPMILIAIACLAIGWRSGERVDLFRWHVSRPLGVQLLLGFLWGFIQQYMLQSFVNRRAQIIWGKGFPGILLVAFIFGGLHLPNPWLTTITFVGGLVWAFVYQRAPNIFALAVSHAVMTWILVSTLPAAALNHLRIGLKYFD